MAVVFNTTISVTIENVSAVNRNPTQPTHVIVLEILLIAVTWLVCIPANVLVCLVVHRSRRVQSTTNYFVVSLAITDHILAVVCTPFISANIIADKWVVGTIICRLVRFFQVLCQTISITVIVAISIDRFYTIIYPLSFKITRGRAKHLIVFCVIVSFVLSVPTLYFVDCWETDLDGFSFTYCSFFIPNSYWGGTVYGALLVTLTFVVPVIVLSVIYSRIFRHVWKIGPRTRLFRRTTNPVSRTKVKMLKMLIYVTSISMFLYAPHYIIQLWHSLTTVQHLHIKLFVVPYIFSFLTTIIKPLFYVLFNSNFRRGCREVFCMTHMKCYRRNNYVITNVSSMSKKNHVGIMPLESKERPLGSPTVTFNRNTVLDKTAWPLSETISSTYI